MNKRVVLPVNGCSSTQFPVKHLFLFVALIVLLISCAHQPTRDSGTVIDKVIEAYGGRERLAKVAAVAAEGRVTALVRNDEGSYRRTFRRDRKLVVDVALSRSTEKRILDGMRGFRGTGGQVEEVFGPRYLAMVYQYNELNLPFGLLDNSFTIVELRRDILHGADVRVLRCTDHEGNELDVFVSAENYRIVKCSGTFMMGTQSMSLGAEFSDFRSIGGVLFPFKIVNYAGGNKISETIMSGYVVNPLIDDELFKP
jgi:hypothetical protein